MSIALYGLTASSSVTMENGTGTAVGLEAIPLMTILTKVQGMGFREAIQTLLDERFAYVSPASNSRPPPKSCKKGSLILPTANKNNDMLCAYLQGRGIDKAVIIRCIEDGSLYEAAKSHHCIFVGYDDYGNPKHACLRGTTSNVKRDVKNSDKRYGFVLPSRNPESRTLAVYESAIDVLSDASIHAMGDRGWDGHRLSLGGVSSLALMGFLERNIDIRHVLLCLDDDKAGKEATGRMIRQLLSDKRFSHVKITVAPPPLGKDYNDTLQAIRQMQMNKAKPSRSEEAEL